MSGGAVVVAVADLALMMPPEDQWRRWVQRWTWHLDQVPGLLEMMRAEAVPLAAFDYQAVRVQTSRDGAPMPFRVDAIDGSDDLWAALVQYADNVQDLMPSPLAPLPAVARWNSRGEIAGIRSMSDVRRDAMLVVGWLVDRVHWIAPLEQLGDTEDHLFAQVRAAHARYGDASIIVPGRPRSKARRCKVCGAAAVVPKLVGRDIVHACQDCGTVADG
jgi:hypothetical protein